MTFHAQKHGAGLLAVPLCALLLSGCSMDYGLPADDPGAGAPAGSAASASVSTAASSGASAEVTFGETIAYDDGLTVTVTDEGEFTPSQHAAKEGATSYREFQITLENGTSEQLDPSLVHPTLQDGEDEAQPVTDVEDEIGVPPRTKVRPGSTVQWTVAYGVDADDLTMHVSFSDSEHEDASFVSE